MKILHTADLHLRALGDERWTALEAIVEACKAEGVSLLAICGDLFDTDAAAEDLRTSIRELFSGNQFHTVIIPGNHDTASYRAGYYFGEQVTFFNNEDYRENVYDLDSARIIGIPFEDIEATEFLRKVRSLAPVLTEDRTNIILYHGELLDAFYSRSDFGPEGERRYMPARLSYFAELGVDYVLAGHFHTKFDPRSIEPDGYFVYPGSPVSITRREVGRRRVNLFEVGGPPGEYLLETEHFEQVDIVLNPVSDPDPLNRVRDRLGEVHPMATILLTIGGYIAQAEDELVSQIEDLLEGRPAEPSYEFRDIRHILSHPLFEVFEGKLAEGEHDEERASRLRDTVIQAMIEARL